MRESLRNVLEAHMINELMPISRGIGRLIWLFHLLLLSRARDTLPLVQVSQEKSSLRPRWRFIADFGIGSNPIWWKFTQRDDFLVAVRLFIRRRAALCRPSGGNFLEYPISKTVYTSR